MRSVSPHWTSFRIGHVKITPGRMDEIAEQVASVVSNRRKASCIPLNLSKYVMAKRDPVLCEAICGADLVIADGLPITWLAKRAHCPGVVRVTGIDLAERLLEMSPARGWRIYFLGAKPELLERAVAAAKERCPGLEVAGARDGYFSPEDEESVVRAINDTSPDILLLGLGLPQKEYFVHRHFDTLNARFTVTVGGAFDIWAGAKRRTPRGIQKVGLEWAYRSMFDLSRAKLILRYGSVFARDLLFYRARGGQTEDPGRTH